MVHYLQRECNLETAVPSGAIIKFDTPLAISETSTETPPEDFEYQEDGTVDVLRAGTYTILWYVTCMTGLSTIGQSYEIKKLDYSLTEPDWVYIAGTSNHIKVSQTTGFAILEVTQEEIDDYGKATIALFNEADADAELTFFVPKASLLIFGLSTEALENKLTSIDSQITDMVSRVFNLEEFVKFSDEIPMWSQTAELFGIGVTVIYSGNTYNFWGTGALAQTETFEEGVAYYLITASQFPPLGYYQGDPTISTLWIETPDSPPVIISLPVRINETGIFFVPDITYADLPAGTIFRFTQSLILVNTST